MKPTIEQVLHYAQSDLEDQVEKIPGPYQIAMTLAHALISCGKYPDPDAAIHAAWVFVPTFYQGQLTYQTTIRELQRNAAFVRARDDGPSHAAATVGGETGDIGEVGAGSPAFATVQVHAPTPEETARQENIIRTTKELQAIDAELAEAQANTPHDAEKILEIQERWNKAAEAQSEAFL